MGEPTPDELPVIDPVPSAGTDETCIYTYETATQKWVRASGNVNCPEEVDGQHVTDEKQIEVNCKTGKRAPSSSGGPSGAGVG